MKICGECTNAYSEIGHILYDPCSRCGKLLCEDCGWWDSIPENPIRFCSECVVLGDQPSDSKPSDISQLRTEHALALAYIEGIVEAAHDGWADRNPYPQNLPLHAEWRRGWETRHRPDKRAKDAQLAQSLSAKKVNELTAAFDLSQDRVRELAKVLKRLIGTMLDCRVCDRPATRAFPQAPEYHYCDEHGIQPQDAPIGGDAPELSYAAALRVALGEIE